MAREQARNNQWMQLIHRVIDTYHDNASGAGTNLKVGGTCCAPSLFGSTSTISHFGEFS